MDSIILKARELLRRGAREEVKAQNEKFFREKVSFYGLKNPDVHRIARAMLKEIGDRSKENIFRLCEELWRSGYVEESLVACDWSESAGRNFAEDDIHLFSRWLNDHVNNWASCDTFCNHTVGELLMKYPGNITFLKKWAGSENRWVKRGSAVSLIIPARRGMFLEDIIEIASILLTDTDDMVQKGYGWMLKAASEAHRDAIFEFVMNNKSKMPRTALRYAIEKMPEDYKKRAMAK
ncbi:MAG TPA: DNA alkylation repair protein [Bacteroidales bacterium]|nr:DNA alkylation repair protein [Bacteroidales bacterium]